MTEHTKHFHAAVAQTCLKTALCGRSHGLLPEQVADVVTVFMRELAKRGEVHPASQLTYLVLVEALEALTSPLARPTPPAFKVGDRVRLDMELNIFNLGAFPSGATGVVSGIAALQNPFQPLGHVRLDESFPHLDEWENELQIWAEDEGEITWSLFSKLS